MPAEEAPEEPAPEEPEQDASPPADEGSPEENGEGKGEGMLELNPQFKIS